jgi:hypothetical protein
MNDNRGLGLSRIAIGIIFAGALMITGLVYFGSMFSTAGEAKVDRNVPGATTGPGKSTVTD